MAKSCPPGKIRRKGSKVKSYTRKDGTKVKGSKRGSVCVPDKGKKDKTPASKKVLPKLEKGGLGKYGLKNLESMKVSDRMKGYEKAIKKEGYAPVVRRLNVLANYTKTSNPKFHKLIKADMLRIKKKLAPIYSLTAKKSKASKSSKRKEIKAGTYKTRDGRTRQLYRLQNGTAKYYKKGGVKRYI